MRILPTKCTRLHTWWRPGVYLTWPWIGTGSWQTDRQTEFP